MILNLFVVTSLGGIEWPFHSGHLGPLEHGHSLWIHRVNRKNGNFLVWTIQLRFLWMQSDCILNLINKTNKNDGVYWHRTIFHFILNLSSRSPITCITVAEEGMIYQTTLSLVRAVETVASLRKKPGNWEWRDLTYLSKLNLDSRWASPGN